MKKFLGLLLVPLALVSAIVDHFDEALKAIEASEKRARAEGDERAAKILNRAGLLLCAAPIALIAAWALL